MKQSNWICAGLLGFLLLSSCDDMHTGTGRMVKTANLFPVEQSNNWWNYSDADGHQFSVSITNAISDGGETYYRARFHESRPGLVDSCWFKKEDGEIYYSKSLSDFFGLFLPSEFHISGGEYTMDGNEITYETHDNYTLGGYSYNHVVELTYETAMFTGFDRISFADKVGPILFEDTRGRFPVSYSLDSASLNGTTFHF